MKRKSIIIISLLLIVAILSTGAVVASEEINIEDNSDILAINEDNLVSIEDDLAITDDNIYASQSNDNEIAQSSESKASEGNANNTIEIESLEKTKASGLGATS